MSGAGLDIEPFIRTVLVELLLHGRESIRILVLLPSTLDFFIESLMKSERSEFDDAGDDFSLFIFIAIYVALRVAGFLCKVKLK